MNVAEKLQIKPGYKVCVTNAPAGFALDLPDEASRVDEPDGADAVLVFARDLSDFNAHGRGFMEAARRDAIAYVVYPKSGQLGTDLNRDILRRHVGEQGLRGVRQISVDEVWSALRFRSE